MSALDMGITAPCPFCRCKDAPDIVEDGDDVYAKCEGCDAKGPPTRIGCRDEEEDGPFDLEREALELWNDRGKDEEVTVEQIYDLCPALAASIAELEAKDPAVRASSKKLDETIAKLSDRAKLMRAELRPKERAVLDRRLGPGVKKND